MWCGESGFRYSKVAFAVCLSNFSSGGACACACDHRQLAFSPPGVVCSQKHLFLFGRNNLLELAVGEGRRKKEGATVHHVGFLCPNAVREDSVIGSQRPVEIESGWEWLRIPAPAQILGIFEEET